MPLRRRRRFPGVAVVAVLGICLAASAGPAAASFESLQLTTVLTGQSDIVGITHAGDDRLFLIYRSGEVRIFDDGQLLATPYLDLSSLITFGSEAGLMGATFHPDYGSNGFFFVYYVDLEGLAVLARYTVSADANVADAASERRLLEIEHTGTHFGGQASFSPGDGFLYLAIGDGGPQTDPNCQAQDTSLLMGKILRLDVDSNVNVAPYHAIPVDNPFVGAPGADEIWAYGLRNPWRLAFDPQSHDLYIADVGQTAREEINFETAGDPGGHNYGWRIMEGTFCHDPDPIVATCPVSTPSCGDPAYTPPVIDYGRDEGECSIIGGVVYRGHATPLHGRYLYGDWCSGRLWATAGPPTWETEQIPGNVQFLVTFGTDVNGEVLLTEGTTLYRLEVDGGLFFDGFETGDASSWTAVVP